MTFTRYLYEKSYVEYSLLIALLDRNEDQALFWTYELYFSGFRQETFALLWKYYFLLYAPFYVRLEKYLQTVTKDWINHQDDHTLIGTFLVNLVIKEPCVDFYFMYYMSDICAYPQIISSYIKSLVETEPIKKHTVYVDFIRDHPCDDSRRLMTRHIYKVLYKTTSLPMFDGELQNMAVLSRMMSHLFLMDLNNHIDSKIFIAFDHYDIKPYLNKAIIVGKSWKIPPKKCWGQQQVPPSYSLVSIDKLRKWLYHSWNSPVWNERFSRYGGYKDDLNETVLFDDDDKEEIFYNMYDLEPDEQNLQTLENWYGKQPFVNWNDIYSYYHKDIVTQWMNQNLH